MNKPNLFDYATKELSQDAFFAWYLRCADPLMNEDNELQISAQTFLYKYITPYTNNIKSVEIKPQYKNIDLLVVVNKDIYVIIEDKIYAGIRKNQLEKYWASIPSEKKVGLFIKTGDASESEISEVEKKHYIYISRSDLLKHFKECHTKNEIFTSYREHWQKIEDERKSFRDNDCWKVAQVLGFYQALGSFIKNSDRHYAANPRGGDFVFNWHWLTIDKPHKTNIYLEFSFPRSCENLQQANEYAEYFKLKIKIHLESENDKPMLLAKTDIVQLRKEIKRFHYTKFNRFSTLLTRPPKRTRLGAYMTIAEVSFAKLIKNNYKQWDMSELSCTLHKYELLLDNYKNTIDL